MRLRHNTWHLACGLFLLCTLVHAIEVRVPCVNEKDDIWKANRDISKVLNDTRKIEMDINSSKSILDELKADSKPKQLFNSSIQTARRVLKDLRIFVHDVEKVLNSSNASKRIKEIPKEILNLTDSVSESLDSLEEHINSFQKLDESLNENSTAAEINDASLAKEQVLMDVVKFAEGWTIIRIQLSFLADIEWKCAVLVEEKGPNHEKGMIVIPPRELPTSKPEHIHHHHLPTMRPRRHNCTPPAIEQFPRPLMGPTARKHGGLIIHLIVAIYTFIGLAIVCDVYFVSSLDRICEELKLTPDVAGATFMAAGSSAPELATVVIGVFFAKDDIGVSGVIGSAVFNIMFVISICALCTSTVSYLNWWPLVRDCFFYMVSILIMLFTIYDEIVSWGEALFMILMYVVYCVVLHFNTRLERWSQTLPVPFPKRAQVQEDAALVSYKHLKEDRQFYTDERAPISDKTLEFGTGYGTDGYGTEVSQQNYDGTMLNENSMPQPPMQQSHPQQPPPVPPPPELHKKEESEEKVSPFVMPEGRFPRFVWGLCVPIHAACWVTIPNCKQEKWKHWYAVTFLSSLFWISFYSYFMVWMITIIGSTLGIPDTVMGLTFVAAGVSVPDALSSLSVVREGYGDMAVSNAVGSNVFDILICLGLPWFIQTALYMPGSHVNVISKGLTYSTLSLLSTVVFLLVATHLNGWKLDKKYGVILMIWYILFIVFASLYELNVFGNLNPPECPSLF